MIRHAWQIVASVWLIVVAVQYLAYCLAPSLKVDYSWAYAGLVAACALVAGSGLWRKTD